MEMVAGQHFTGMPGLLMNSGTYWSFLPPLGAGLGWAGQKETGPEPGSSLSWSRDMAEAVGRCLRVLASAAGPHEALPGPRWQGVPAG